jgi:thioredoxin reductase (NADPH)
MIVRGHSLSASMSRYLVERIAATPNIEIMYNTSVSALDGTDGMLQAIRSRSHFSGENGPAGSATCSCSSAPNPIWIGWPAGIALDDKGFVRTGGDLRGPLETNLPGVFAIGDVRCGSVKRVAAAVGDGAQVVAAMHAFLAKPDNGATPARIGGP